MPEVSVIIPTYNRAKMIPQAIQSVLNQEFTDWELIIVDDGSKDNTRDVVAQFADPRIRYLYQKNSGTPGARNTGILASGGKYIAFLDSDDLFLPAKLQLQVSALENRAEIGLIASGWREVDLQQRPRRTRQPWKLNRGLSLTDWLYRCPLIVPAVLVRREWLIQVGLFDPQLRYIEDWDLWLRLARAGCPMAWEPGIVCQRTIHADSKIRDVSAMSAGLFRMLEKFFAQPDLGDDVRQQRDLVYARAHLDGAARAYGAGLLKDAEKHLRRAIRLNPALLKGEPPAALQSLASTALTPLVTDIDQYVSDLCRSLPRVSPLLTRTPRQMRAVIRATTAFDDLSNGRRQQARLKAAAALLTDPAWLRNRGLLSILLKPRKHKGSTA